MVAVSSDPLLLNWEKVTGQAVIPHAKPGDPPLPYNIFDPCIWKRGEYYYILTAGTLPDGPGGKRSAPNSCTVLKTSPPGNTSASLPGKRSLRPGGRRWRLPLFLAHRQPPHPHPLQSHHRREIPARRLRHRAGQVRGHQWRRLQFRPQRPREACMRLPPAPRAKMSSSSST